METYKKWSTVLLITLTVACSSRENLSTSKRHKNPVERAKVFNYNANQANYVVNYNVKHKKQRQRIAEQNRNTTQENLIKLNESRSNPDLRYQKGAFHIYRNN